MTVSHETILCVLISKEMKIGELEKEQVKTNELISAMHAEIEALRKSTTTLSRKVDLQLAERISVLPDALGVSSLLGFPTVHEISTPLDTSSS